MNSWAAGAALCVAMALRAQTPVTLESPLAPGIAEPGVTTVTLTATGFPSGTISPANVTVTLQPKHSGDGPSGATEASTARALFGTTVQLTFTVPTTIEVHQSVSYLVSIEGTTSTGAAFTSGNAAALSIAPVASLFSVGGKQIGSWGSPGQSLQFNIIGQYTNFLQGSTEANFGPGVSVGGAPPGDWGPVTVNTPTTATAQVVISTSASYGVNPLMVATGLEQESYSQNFTIQNFSPVYSFQGSFAGDGANPKRVPIIGTVPGGVPSLYGVTPYGGTANFGAVYSFPLAFGSSDTVLYSFAGPPNDGETPDGALVLASNGVLYGTTGGGGSDSASGIVFSLAPPATPGGPWTETVLHNFAGGPSDGANSYAALVVAGEQGGLPVLLGTTYNGGTRSNGIVFSLSPPSTPGGAWTESFLHFFAGAPNDGANPHTAVTPGSNGVYYGTTYNGGASNNGTVYQLTPPSSPAGEWTESVLYSFAGTPTDGANPHGDLVLGPGGVLYGTTLGGGPMGRGTVFSLTPPLSPRGKWTEKLLYKFANGTDASEPRAGLVMSTAPGGEQVLYGTTYLGGTYGDGTVFSLTAPATPDGSWTETILVSFQNFDGINPEAGVVMDSTGALYGATYSGGDANFGLIYYLVP